eukprot:1194802-Prorocentrum_minimum.AAC.3
MGQKSLNFQDFMREAEDKDSGFFEVANNKIIQYTAPGETNLEIEQDTALHDSCGGIIWETSFILATYLEQHLKSRTKRPLHKIKVVELGAGVDPSRKQAPLDLRGREGWIRGREGWIRGREGRIRCREGWIQGRRVRAAGASSGVAVGGRGFTIGGVDPQSEGEDSRSRGVESRAQSVNGFAVGLLTLVVGRCKCSRRV